MQSTTTLQNGCDDSSRVLLFSSQVGSDACAHFTKLSHYSRNVFPPPLPRFPFRALRNTLLRLHECYFWYCAYSRTLRGTVQSFSKTHAFLNYRHTASNSTCTSCREKADQPLTEDSGSILATHDKPCSHLVKPCMHFSPRTAFGYSLSLGSGPSSTGKGWCKRAMLHCMRGCRWHAPQRGGFDKFCKGFGKCALFTPNLVGKFKQSTLKRIQGSLRYFHTMQVLSVHSVGIASMLDEVCGFTEPPFFLSSFPLLQE